ncbi:MAG: hypothetical protein ABFD04_10105 [Syntrophomonas sp.]
MKDVIFTSVEIWSVALSLLKRESRRLFISLIPNQEMVKIKAMFNVMAKIMELSMLIVPTSQILI